MTTRSVYVVIRWIKRMWVRIPLCLSREETHIKNESFWSCCCICVEDGYVRYTENSCALNMMMRSICSCKMTITFMCLHQRLSLCLWTPRPLGLCVFGSFDCQTSSRSIREEEVKFDGVIITGGSHVWLSLKNQLIQQTSRQDKDSLSLWQRGRRDVWQKLI